MPTPKRQIRSWLSLTPNVANKLESKGLKAILPTRHQSWPIKQPPFTAISVKQHLRFYVNRTPKLCAFVSTTRYSFPVWAGIDAPDKTPVYIDLVGGLEETVFRRIPLHFLS